jgi:hypothetical protein
VAEVVRAPERIPTYGGRVTSLLWLAIPVVALLAAVAWAAWAGRPRGPGDPVDSVEAHHRFVEALEKSRHEPLPGDFPQPDPPR